MNRRIITTFLLSLVALGHAATATAQVSVLPLSPKAHDTVRVQVPVGGILPAVLRFGSSAVFDTYNPHARVSMAGNKIVVMLELSDSGFPEHATYSPALDFPVGQFPAGTYEVEVATRLPDGTPVRNVGSTTFSVAPLPAASPRWNHTDLWWNPEESGWGLTLVQHETGVIFATWYVYGADGKSTWFVVPEGQWSTPYEYRGPVYRTTGPAMGTCSASGTNCAPFDPKAVTATLVGSAVFAFNEHDASAAHASFTIDGVTIRRPIQRYGSSASSRLRAFPDLPSPQGSVRLQVPTGIIGSYDPRSTTVTMAGTKLGVVVQASNPEQGTSATNMDLPLGQFPAGTYQVELSRRPVGGAPANVIGTTTFTVAPRLAMNPMGNNTDLWWTPTESGWGLSVIQHGPGLIFATWYVYGADGKAIWYVIPEGVWTTPTQFDGPVYRTTGPALGGCTGMSCPPFDPVAVKATLAGRAILHLYPYHSQGTAVFLVDGLVVARLIQRLSF